MRLRKREKTTKQAFAYFAHLESKSAENGHNQQQQQQQPPPPPQAQATSESDQVWGQTKLPLLSLSPYSCPSVFEYLKFQY